MEELETAPEAGVRGITVARDRGGLYVARAPKSLRVRPGDRLLGARFDFEGAPPEEVGRVLEGARSCKVSFCLRRPPRGPPTPPGTQGRRGKVARLRIPLPTPSQKPPPTPPGTKPPPLPAVSLELALPKPGRNRGSAPPPPVAPVATSPEPRWPRPRLTVKEAAAGKTGGAMEDEEGERGGRRLGGLRFPSIPVAAPGAAVELVPVAKPEPPLPPASPPPGGVAVPAIEVAAPPLEVDLALPAGTGEEEEEEEEDEDDDAATGGLPEAAAKFAKGLGKLSLELETPPGLEIAPPAGLAKTPPKLARLGSALAKLRGGGGGEAGVPTPHPLWPLVATRPGR